MTDEQRIDAAIRIAEREEEIRAEGLEDGYAEVVQYLETQVEKHPKVTAQELIDSASEWFGVK